MTGTQTLIARSALGICTVSAGVIAVSLRRFQRGDNLSFGRRIQFVFLATRLGLYSLLFLVFRVAPRGDIVAYYFPEALHILQGGLPYRGLPSSYAPLHPYLDAAAILFWRTPVAIILLAILFEAFLLPVWLRLGRELFPERDVRIAAILYVASPISLQFVAVDGQDNVIIALLLAAGMLCLLQRREVQSGALVAIGAVAIKFLPILFFPAFLISAERRIRWAAGLIGVLLAGYGWFAFLRLPLLMPLTIQKDLKSGGTLWFVLESVSGSAIPGLVCDAALVIAVIGIYGLMIKAAYGSPLQPRLRVLTFTLAALTLTLLLVSKKSWSPYLMLALFPICLAIAARSQSRIHLYAFAVFSVVAIVAQSFLSSILLQTTAQNLHDLAVTGHATAIVAIILQTLLIAGYVWLLSECVQALSKAARKPHVPFLQEALTNL